MAWCFAPYSGLYQYLARPLLSKLPAKMNKKVSIACFSLLCIPSFGQAYDAAYLRTVKAEVAEFTTGHIEVSGNNAWTLKQAGPAGDAVDADLQREFEALLRKRMPGTFIQYRRLSGAYRASLFSLYRETGDLQRVRRKILATLHRH